MSPSLNVQDIGDDLSGEDYYGPASSVHCSVEDLARYAAFHLQGLRAMDGVLKAQTVRRLHTPLPGQYYMGGWIVKKENEGERRDGHEGTAGTFFAMVQLYPNENLAVVAAANIGPPAAPYLRKMRDAIHQRMKNKSYASGAYYGVEWPDTIAARREKAFVEAMNAGDEESTHRFMSENYSSASLSLRKFIILYQCLDALYHYLNRIQLLLGQTPSVNESTIIETALAEVNFTGFYHLYRDDL